jgi:hypothetical protein
MRHVCDVTRMKSALTPLRFGLTLSVSPHLRLLDETSRRARATFQCRNPEFADRELVPDRVTGAAELLSADDRSCLQAHDGIKHESLTPAAHSRPRPGLACGRERRSAAASRRSEPRGR